MATKKAASPEIVSAIAKVKQAKAALDSAKTDQQKTQAKAGYETAKHTLGALRFKSLAGKRVTKALASIINVAKLGGRGYTYTPEQVTKIKEAIAAECRKMDAAFSGTQKTVQNAFEI